MQSKKIFVYARKIYVYSRKMHGPEYSRLLHGAICLQKTKTKMYGKTNVWKNKCTEKKMVWKKMYGKKHMGPNI